MERIVRDRRLTAEEAAKYDALREQIEKEKPEINSRIRAQLAARRQAEADRSGTPTLRQTERDANVHFEPDPESDSQDHVGDVARAAPWAHGTGEVAWIRCEEVGVKCEIHLRDSGALDRGGANQLVVDFLLKQLGVASTQAKKKAVR